MLSNVEALKQKYRAILGEEEVEDFIKHALKGFPQVLRVNTNVVKEDRYLIEILESKGMSFKRSRVYKHAYIIINAPFSPASTVEYLAGKYFLQEESSLIPPLILGPQPDDIVLDMCAAPGVKTTHMAELMKNRGVIVAIEPNRARARKLRSNLQRMLVENTIVFRMDGRDAWKLGIEFDKVLVDAPCTGEGNLYKMKKVPTQKFLERITDLQVQLLKTAIDVVREGGVVVYSTCSAAPEENEGVISRILDDVERVKLDKIDVPYGSNGIVEFGSIRYNEEVRRCLRIWPHRDNMPCFFVARLIKC